MRNDWRVRAAVLLGSVLAAGGCSTTQPDSLGTRTASLRIVTRADVGIFNCYEIWSNDINGIPAYQEFNECYVAPNAIGQPDVANRPVPWNYSLIVSIIHKDSSAEEIVTSLNGVFGSSVQPNDGVDDFISLTEYDPTEQPADFKPPEERPGYGLVQFLNGKKVSRGSTFWLGTSGFPIFDPNILTEFPTFDFEVNSGDTVIVRARKQTLALSPDFIPRVPDPNIRLSGTLAIGGVQVFPSGTQQSSGADGAGISFSFTVQ